VSRERALRDPVGLRSSRQAAVSSTSLSNYARCGHQMAPTGACSACRMWSNCERAQRMQAAVSDEKETGAALCVKPSVMVESLKNSRVGCTAESRSGLLARFPASPSMSRPEQGEAGPIRVLVVEDDENYREIVASELSWHGFTVRSFAHGDALLGSLDAAAAADVIVLDWRLPTISGIDLLPQLRRRGVNLPVVFLTSHADPAYEKLAFERGALDFIDKTRGVEVLARRLRLAANSGNPDATPEAKKAVICGKLVLSPSASRGYWNEVDVGLTVSEYAIVHFLASSVGNYETYRAIYDVQYYEGVVDGQGNQGYRTNVRSSIKRIRRKFCKVDSTFSEIQNSPSRGYRWRGLTRSQ
jgi:two-component system, OmpR family, response regulator ChvI